MEVPDVRIGGIAVKGKAKATGLAKDLRDFLLKGNVIALAVGVIIGVAFNALVTSFTDNVLMQIIGIFGDEPDFSAYVLTIGGSDIRWGTFLNDVISFLIIGITMFFVVKITSKLFREEEDEPSDEVVLLTEIRDELRKQSATD